MCGQIACLSVVTDDGLLTLTCKRRSRMSVSVALMVPVVRLITNVRLAIHLMQALPWRLLRAHDAAVEDYPCRRRWRWRWSVASLVMEDVLTPVRSPVSTRGTIFSARLQEVWEVASRDNVTRQRQSQQQQHQNSSHRDMTAYTPVTRWSIGRHGKSNVCLCRGRLQNTVMCVLLYVGYCRSAWTTRATFSRFDRIFSFADPATYSPAAAGASAAAAAIQYNNHRMQHPNVDQESRGTRKTRLAGRQLQIRYIALRRTFSTTDTVTDEQF